MFLLYGDGGMGKTMLAKRFRDIATLEQPFEGNFQTLWIDWEDERRLGSRGLTVGREHISAETVFDVIFAAGDEDWEKSRTVPSRTRMSTPFPVQEVQEAVKEQEKHAEEEDEPLITLEIIEEDSIHVFLLEI